MTWADLHPSDFVDKAIRAELDDLVRTLNKLRILFDGHIRQGTIKPCGCGKPDCPVFMVSPPAAAELDAQRNKILKTASRLIPGFHVAPDF